MRAHGQEGIQKKIFHCDKCGICRVGGRENYCRAPLRFDQRGQVLISALAHCQVHCDACGSCEWLRRLNLVGCFPERKAQRLSFRDTGLSHLRGECNAAQLSGLLAGDQRWFFSRSMSAPSELLSRAGPFPVDDAGHDPAMWTHYPPGNRFLLHCLGSDRRLQDCLKELQNSFAGKRRSFLKWALDAFGSEACSLCAVRSVALRTETTSKRLETSVFLLSQGQPAWLR